MSSSIDIRSYLNANFSELHVGDEDIARPKGSRICKIYSALLMSILELPERAITDLPLEMMPPSYDPDVHGHTMPKFLLVFHLNNCLNDICDPAMECTPKDIIYPHSERTLSILKHLVAYHRFRQKMHPHINHIRKHQKTRILEMDALRQAISNGAGEDLDSQIREMQQKRREAEEKYERHDGEAKAKTELVEEEKKKSGLLDQKIANVQTSIGSFKTSNLTMQCKLEGLKGDLVSSPGKIIGQREKLRQENETMADTLEEHRQNGHKCAALIESYTKLLGQLETSADDYEHLKTRIGALQPQHQKTADLKKECRSTKQKLADAENKLKEQNELIAEEEQAIRRQQENHACEVAKCNARIADVQREIDALRARGEQADEELEHLAREYQNVLFERGQVEGTYTKEMRRIEEAIGQNDYKMQSEQAKWEKFIKEKKAYFKSCLDLMTSESDENVSPDLKEAE